MLSMLLFLLSLRDVTSMTLAREREEVNGGTSGHVDGVRVGNFVSWSTAQIHPEQQGPGRKQGIPASIGDERATEDEPG